MRLLSRFNYRLEDIAKSGSKAGESAGRVRWKILDDPPRSDEGPKGLAKFLGSGSKRDNSKITVKTSQKAPDKGTHRRNWDEPKRRHVCVGKVNGRQKGQ